MSNIMSFLSASENVGFSGIPQSITETSCATQYKMVAEGVSGACPEVNHFNDIPNNDQYLSHINDNYFHTKFKIDPNELYTFQDSDIIAGEITVSHTEDSYFNDSTELKDKIFLDSPQHEEIIMTNGFMKDDTKQETVSNGHYKPEIDVPELVPCQIEKPANVAKHAKSKDVTIKENIATSPNEVNNKVESLINPVSEPDNVPSGVQNVSINSVNLKNASKPPPSSHETFLDVFKREQRVGEDISQCKNETTVSATPPPLKPVSAQKKASSSSKTQSCSKRRGRGPTVHEALERIPKKVVTVANRKWHAPGYDLFDCGPLVDKPAHPFRYFDDSSDEDDYMPVFGERLGCVEESSIESRGARLAVRRAAMRRQVLQAAAASKLTTDTRRHSALATALKKELNQAASSKLPPHAVNHLLVSRGMTSLFTSDDRRHLKSCGVSVRGSGPWGGCDGCGAGGGGGGGGSGGAGGCGGRCARLPRMWGRSPPRETHNLLQHDNHEVVLEKKRVETRNPRVAPRRPPRRRRPASADTQQLQQQQMPQQQLPQQQLPQQQLPLQQLPQQQMPLQQLSQQQLPLQELSPQQIPQPELTQQDQTRHPSLSELNSTMDPNSSCESAEEAAIEFIAHELEVGEVGHVAADDILDPAVLSQIPDEAFTEFFNQAEGGAGFAHSSELTRALEAVLDDCDHKLHASASIGVEMSSPAPS